MRALDFTPLNIGSSVELYLKVTCRFSHILQGQERVLCKAAISPFVIHYFILQERRQKLDESYYLHRFLADFRDLISWINDMKAIISADELAKDVAGAEALLERHQEHKVNFTIL